MHSLEKPTHCGHKVNVDGGATGASGFMTGDGVFRDSFGVFHGCFTIALGRGFAIGAELSTTLLVICDTHGQGWMNSWMECE
ncbi:hypothetical protein ACS0TY_028051 [Phlomoides rotata]